VNDLRASSSVPVRSPLRRDAARRCIIWFAGSRPASLNELQEAETARQGLLRSPSGVEPQAVTRTPVRLHMQDSPRLADLGRLPFTEYSVFSTRVAGGG